MDSLSRHTDYGSVGLSESDLDADPMVQFARWLDDVERAEVYEPNAMVVGTVDPDGAPSSRTVLLKGMDVGAAPHFDFVTNYGSRKARALDEHRGVTLLFPWYSLQRQVIVAGIAERAPIAVSDAYFEARPRDSRIGSAASEQSRPIASRVALEAQVAALVELYADGRDVPRPDGWG
ncbi:MAG: hypothetical protein RI885_567, partial [Actinomycetota bacterium]